VLKPTTTTPNFGLVDRLHAALPQTQCTRCGYTDCRAYAQAMAQGEALSNQCPPGGEDGAKRLAGLLGQTALPLNPEHGQEGPRHLAVIDEDWCIGCTLCLEACPVDALVGAPKHMHTVIETECTGCALCVPVCPVDCIELQPATQTTGWQAWSPEQAERALTRYESRKARRERDHLEHQQRLMEQAQAKLADLEGASLISDPAVLADKRQRLSALLARARQGQAAPG
jgi:electron transport complex protein RnfB